jgi:hypothetical protein
MITDARTGGLEGAGPSDALSTTPMPRGAAAGRLPTGGKPELTENEIQKAVFSHLRTRGAPGIFAFHPKNGSSDMVGRRAGIYAALGVEPGVPDVIVLKPCVQLDGAVEVFALELKRESRRGKKPTKHELKQKDCRVRMTHCGVITGHAYGIDDALGWLERYGLLVGRAA